MSEFQIGDIAWAKLGRSPPWPCVIIKTVAGIRKASKDPNRKYYWVFFFGSNNFAWIPKSQMSNFEENREKNIQPNDVPYFTEAVEEAEEHLGRMKSNPDYKVVVTEEFKLKEKRKRSTRKTHKFKNEVKLKGLTVDIHNCDFSENMECSKGVLDTRQIQTSKLVFGVLGIGIIGSGVVKNLILSGHIVNIWNRTMSKCDRLIDDIGDNFKKSVKSFFSPRSLLQNSDIVFVCVSNQDVANRIFRYNFGINNPKDTILKNKGIVQMTTTGPETSKDIKAIIEKQGGKYLEAQIQGSRSEAIQGNLLVLAAGEESLFYDCQSCFKAIGKTAMYLGEVGYASKLNLILQTIKGVNLAILAEAISLAERCAVPPTFLLTICNLCQIASPYLNEKANIIIKKDFNNVEQALKHLQMDLKLGLDLSNDEQEPMFLANVANEMFKHCERLDYGNQDAASIYMRNKH